MDELQSNFDFGPVPVLIRSCCIISPPPLPCMPPLPPLPPSTSDQNASLFKSLTPVCPTKKTLSEMMATDLSYSGTPLGNPPALSLLWDLRSGAEDRLASNSPSSLPGSPREVYDTEDMEAGLTRFNQPRNMAFSFGPGQSMEKQYTPTGAPSPLSLSRDHGITSDGRGQTSIESLPSCSDLDRCSMVHVRTTCHTDRNEEHESLELLWELDI